MTDATSGGYRILPDQASEDQEAAADVAAEIAERGYQPYVAGDSFVPGSMDRDKAMVLMQAGAEYLARLGGAQTGDWVTSSALNRGFLIFLRGRDRFGTGRR